MVTGAASGLGRAFALALAEAGAAVSCLDRDRAGLEETVQQIGQSGGEALAVIMDVADPTQVAAAAAETASWKGRPSVLINNAGVATPPARAHEVEIEDWDYAMGINLRGVFLCTRAFLPAMMADPGASIINISSFLGLVGAYPHHAITASPYAASKAALVGLTRQWALEYASDGVRVNAIAPGWHRGTNLGGERRKHATPEQLAWFDAFVDGSIPMGRRGTPDDLVGLVIYLASDASCYLTGQVIAHDGGLCAA